MKRESRSSAPRAGDGGLTAWRRAMSGPAVSSGVSTPDQLAVARQASDPDGVSGSDHPIVTFGESTHAFLSSRPEWTMNGALLKARDGRAARATQSPFAWVAGVWQCTVTLIPIEAPIGAKSLDITVQISPDTLRRWAEIGINPFLEACAQLEEYWRKGKSFEHAQLTLL